MYFREFDLGIVKIPALLTRDEQFRSLTRWTFDKIDTDASGKLSRDELRLSGFREPDAALRAFDDDRDGDVSVDEFHAHSQRLPVLKTGNPKFDRALDAALFLAHSAVLALTHVMVRAIFFPVTLWRWARD